MITTFTQRSSTSIAVGANPTVEAPATIPPVVSRLAAELHEKVTCAIVEDKFEELGDWADLSSELGRLSLFSMEGVRVTPFLQIVS